MYALCVFICLTIDNTPVLPGRRGARPRQREQRRKTDINRSMFRTKRERCAGKGANHHKTVVAASDEQIIRSSTKLNPLNGFEYVVEDGVCTWWW